MNRKKITQLIQRMEGDLSSARYRIESGKALNWARSCMAEWLKHDLIGDRLVYGRPGPGKSCF